MTPTVSIVMAARNYAAYLPAAIDSVLAQTYPDWELLVVDDGSTDRTPATVASYLGDSRIRYFRADRLGQARAKNLGIGMSRGPIVAFLDADDVWHPTKLARQLPLLQEDQSTGVVYSRRSLIDEHGRPLPARGRTEFHRGRVLEHLFVQNFVCFSTAIVRRGVLSHVGMFDPQWDLAIDYDLWLRIARHYQFDYVDEELVLYRTGHGNLSSKLADRVDTALSIMHRAEHQLGLCADVPRTRIADAYASTCRTLAYVMRSSEPATSARWYVRALSWPSGRLISFKGLVAATVNYLSGRRSAGAPHNATINR
jgi:glycosyltransferase involved in cell wall biosynthesis